MAQQFHPPPDWPVPSDWTPSPDWRPDPSWPPAPPGWKFWVDSPVDESAADPHAEYRRQAAEHVRQSGAPDQQPPPAVFHPEKPQPATYRGAHAATESGRYPQPTKPTGTATIIFGVVSLVGAMPIAFLGARGQAFDYFRWYPLFTVNLVGIIGALASARTQRRWVAIFCAVQGAGLLALMPGVITGYYRNAYGASLFFRALVIFLCALAILAGAIGVIVSGARAHAASTRKTAAAPPQPAGYTAEGRPYYPIVGYTSDGTPITADQARGYRAPSTGTNAMAITAFILSLTISVLAIPFGHVARAQIRRTGEQGAGLALAALIIGYIFAGILLIVVIAVIALVGPVYI